MSGSKRLKTDFIIWLLTAAIGLSSFGCNSANQSSKQLIRTENTPSGVGMSTWRDETAAANPQALSKRDRAKRVSSLGDTLNGVGKTLGNAAKFSADVVVVGAIIGGCVIGSMYLDYQVWRLEDKMF